MNAIQSQQGYREIAEEPPRIVEYSLQWLAFNNTPVVLYGLGNNVLPHVFHTFLHYYGVRNIPAVLDRDPLKQGMLFKGTLVIRPEDAGNLGPGIVAIICAIIPEHIDEIRRTATGMGMVALTFKEVAMLTCESVYRLNRVEGPGPFGE